MSLYLKHIYTYKVIAEHYEHALIMEDDVILCEGFATKLNTYISQLPECYDMLFIGDGCDLHIQKDRLIQGQYIYEKCLEPTSWGGLGATRCTDSYIVSKKCAKTLYDYICNLKYQIDLPIDWWLNVAARDNQLKVYWAEPTIVSQGSEIGLFNSSITPLSA